MKALHALLTGLLLVTSFAVAQESPAAALQRRADAATGMDCVHLSMQAARKALEDADHDFGAGDLKAAYAAIDLSLHYAQRSVDCSLQSHKGEKTTEINLRALIRRMRDIVQTLDSEDRQHLSQSITELEKQRDRLLRGIFGPAAGGSPEKKP
jgi:hypothetical protein